MYNDFEFYDPNTTVKPRLSLKRHLPKALRDQKLLYGDKEKLAWKAGKKTRWSIDFDALPIELYLVVDGKRVQPIKARKYVKY